MPLTEDRKTELLLKMKLRKALKIANITRQQILNRESYSKLCHGKNKKKKYKQQCTDVNLLIMQDFENYFKL